MKRVLWGDSTNPELNHALGDWCAAQIGLLRGFRDHTSMGVFEGPDLVAVMVFHDWHPERGVIEISGAGISPRWLTRPVLKEFFSYPFDELKCRLVVMRVSERDTRLLRILTAYGFDHVLVPELRGPGEGERIFTLTASDWRSNGFHKEHADGEVSTQADAA